MVWCLKSPNNGAEVVLKSPFVPLFSKGESYEDGKQKRTETLNFVTRKRQVLCSPLWKRGARGDFRVEWGRELCSELLSQETRSARIGLDCP